MGRKNKNKHRQDVPAVPPDPQNEPSPAQRLIHQYSAIARYSGPIPPPEVLQRYNDIEPGFANRIMAMAERQAQHRQALETEVITARMKSERRGQGYGFIIAMTAVLGSIWLLAHGQKVEGLIGLLGTITSLAGVFVYGRYSQQKENIAKRNEAAAPQ